MTLFYASNGSTVELLANRLHVNGASLGGLSIEALEEFFLAEHDKRNGVWRQNADSPYVVRDAGPDSEGDRRVQIFDESTGVCEWVTESQGASNTLGAWRQAFLWFQAHPIRKPWHDAKQGEVWLLDIVGRKESTPAVFNRFGRFASNDNMFHVKSRVILGATKIYPKD